MLRTRIHSARVCLMASIGILLVSQAAFGMVPISGGLYISDVRVQLDDSDGDGYDDTVISTLEITNSNFLFSSTARVMEFLNTSTGTNVAIDTNSVSVPAGAVRTLQVRTTTVYTPDGETSYWSEDVVRDEQGDFMDSVAGWVRLHPLGQYDLALTTQDPPRTAGPGDDIVYAFTIVSLSNNNDTFQMAASSSAGWTFDLSGTSAFLNPRLTTNGTVTVHVPSSAAPETTDVTTVTVTSTKDDTKEQTLAFTTTVASQTYDLELTSDETSMVKPLGGTASYTVTIENTGNFEDTISLDLSAPPTGWGTTLSSYSATLGAGVSRDVSLTVNLPTEYTGVKQMESSITGSSKDGVTERVVRLTTVIGLADIVIGDLDVVVDNENPIIGDSVEVTVTVHNEGTVPAADVVVDVEVSGVTETLSKSIDVGSQEDYVFTFTPAKGLQTITATADPAEALDEFDDTNNAGTAQITVHTADLTMASTDISFDPAEPNGDDEVEVTITLHNTGTAHAENFAVYMEVDGQHADDGVVTLVEKNGGTFDLVLTWTAVPGSHEFEVTLDSDLFIDEMNEDNNVATVTLDVNSPPTAAIEAMTDDVVVGVALTIDASPSTDEDGSVARYLFDFGDGPDSGWVTTSSVTHVYGTTGTYTLTVSVEDDSGAVSLTSATTEVVVLPENVLPTAAVAPIDGKIEPGDPAIIDAATSSDSDGTVEEYFFDFGDGTDSGWVTTSRVTHLYASAGTYTVTVKVKDDRGGISTSEATLDLKVQKPQEDDSPGFGAIGLVAALSIAMIAIRRRR